MDIKLLGPVEVHQKGEPVELSAAKTKTVLAALLLARGQIVGDAKLFEVLWGDDPPATAEAQVQNYVSRLRKKVGPAARIIRQRPGYLLRMSDGRVDLFEFERLAGEGRAALAGGRPAEAADKLTAALVLWRGPALAGVTEHLAEVERASLEETRAAALETRIDADLELGRHAELVPELTSLVAAEPLRERFRAQLMIATHRSGRQADALKVYQDYRAVLVRELGLEPSSDLRDLRQRVLTDSLDARAEPRPAVVVPAPRRPLFPVPPAPADFTGRDEEVRSALRDLAPGARRRRRHAAHVVTGMAGVGKTAFAVHLANLVPEDDAGVRIFIDLRGTDPVPAAPRDVLADLLRALGADHAEIPDGVEDRRLAYLSRLAGRQVLLLLDDAADERQVRPLLPDGPDCVALVTSRQRLPALEGTWSVDLPVLDLAASLDLLAGIVGARRLAAEPRAARRVAELCGGLPVALRIAGARLAAKPHQRVEWLGDRLSRPQDGLDELGVADLDLRSVLAPSLAGLPDPARRAFRLLALPVVPSLSVWDAAVALDVTVQEAREVVERLVDVRLLDVTRTGDSGELRYSFHGLVRRYAAELAAREETPTERHAVLSRSLGPSPVRFTDEW
ncbi:transcriptional regulator [Actinosynnema sp. NPDC050436]|uniref:AfsR/SARP family transcriptional regulator n=1 Tax=Actinosynnema sp. NPDC050436 TaxID=3155659 RepID=UPI0033CB499A